MKTGAATEGDPAGTLPGAAAGAAAHRQHRRTRPKRSAAAGQSIVESCIAMGIICLIFFGMFQVSQLFAAREVAHHAAARGARARTVGFNRSMVHRSIRVAAIPNAGRIVEPAYQNVDTALRAAMAAYRAGDFWSWALGATPSSSQYVLEQARIPEYLGSENWAQAHYVLDYEGWDSVHASYGGAGVPGVPAQPGEQMEVRVWQDYPLWVPMRAAFYAESNVQISASFPMENHYPLYLDDLQL